MGKPYFNTHIMNKFKEGDNFHYNSVHFKVVAVDPPDQPGRVGPGTEIFTEGSLHPTVENFLSPAQLRSLARYPPGVQAVILQSEVFSSSDIASRIIEWNERHDQALQHAQNGVSGNFLARQTEEHIWSQEVQQRLNTDQTECIVCLRTFEDGERIR